MEKIKMFRVKKVIQNFSLEMCSDGFFSKHALYRAPLTCIIIIIFREALNSPKGRNCRLLGLLCLKRQTSFSGFEEKIH